MRKSEILKKKNVVGIGRGKKIVNGKETNIDSIRIYVSKKMKPHEISAEDYVPEEIDGIATDVIEIGEVRAFESLPDPKQHYDNLFPGVSISGEGNWAGTFGYFYLKDGKILCGTNAHVVGEATEDNTGKKIYQPGLGEGNGQYEIGKVVKDMKVTDGSKIDFSLFKTYKDNYNFTVPGIGKCSGVNVSVKVKDKLKKFGRTTKYTEGEVIDTSVDIKVNYGKKVLLIRDCVLISIMGAPGDSGSAIFDEKNRIVGHLFAGSDKVTIMCKISNIMKNFKVLPYIDKDVKDVIIRVEEIEESYIKLRVRVINQYDKPVSGVNVKIGKETKVTDENGYVMFKVKDRHIIIEVTGDKIKDKKVEVNI